MSATWTAKELAPSFRRAVVGYDVRPQLARLVVHPPGLAMATRIAIGREEWKPATIDSDRWPSLIGSAASPHCNGLNLVPTAAQASALARQGEKGIVVAFDFPATLVDTVAATFGLDLGPAESKPQWDLLGYDIVDIRTQSSALYSFDWNRDEWIKLGQALGFRLNSFGLIDAEAVAIAESISFDQRVAEHAPFAPCGIWACGTG